PTPTPFMFFPCTAPASTPVSTLSLHDALPILSRHMYGDASDTFIDNEGNGLMDDLNGDHRVDARDAEVIQAAVDRVERKNPSLRSEEHTSELQSLAYLVCRLLLEKKKK